MRRGRAQDVKVATAGAVAAVIVEPMQGTAGNIIPPKEFLPAMKSIADEQGALFIADEMITGLGRTGTWWGVDHTGVMPDIVTIGKAVGGGFPLSALLTTDAIARAQAVGRRRRASRRATAATRWRRRPARRRCGSSRRRSWSRTRATSAR